MKGIGKSESGEVMLEGMIVMIVTMLMMVWVLGVGFIYYQKYTVRIVTNDAATKIAATYDAPTTDIIMGYISANDMSKKSIYSSNDLVEINRRRAESYVRYILDKANFGGVVSDVSVGLDYIHDAMGRSHVTVTTKCAFHTPFGEALEFFGMRRNHKYSVTSTAESTNLTDYISSVTIADGFTNGTFLSGTGAIEKTVKMINSFIEVYNQYNR